LKEFMNSAVAAQSEEPKQHHAATDKAEPEDGERWQVWPILSQHEAKN
jgi:hypothetical protein